MSRLKFSAPFPTPWFPLKERNLNNLKTKIVNPVFARVLPAGWKSPIWQGSLLFMNNWFPSTSRINVSKSWVNTYRCCIWHLNRFWARNGFTISSLFLKVLHFSTNVQVYKLACSWNLLILTLSLANGHITLNTPVLVRSLKLSNVESSQYLDGWPPGNTGCCWLLSFYSFLANFSIPNQNKNEKLAF